MQTRWLSERKPFQMLRTPPFSLALCARIQRDRHWRDQGLPPLAKWAVTRPPASASSPPMTVVLAAVVMVLFRFLALFEPPRMRAAAVRLRLTIDALMLLRTSSPTMSEVQIKQKLEKDGYTNITGLKAANDGTWMGKAMRNGK